MSKSLGVPATVDDTDINSQLARHTRIFRTWMEERQYQFKCVEHMVSRWLDSKAETLLAQPPETQDGLAAIENTVNQTGQTLLNSWKVSTDRPSDWLQSVTSMLRAAAQKIYEGSGTFQSEGPFEEVERTWCQTQAIEAIFLMRTAISVLQSLSELTSASDVEAWFSFMDEVNFFEDFETVCLY